MSPPQYWHRVELSDNAQFNINFWSEKDHEGSKLMQQSKVHNQPIDLLDNLEK